MLKALDLIGFKSFADKTRFEFPSGITVVVGPNGSGKSNVVDAIKWVLGEQSVKSLRGKEMTDVIFNGSGSRRAINTAEVTLTFDNTEKRLPIDSSEVHITRRVYRSGEGEYLINRQPSRLRDIRELLSGTGMGTQAYSVIEQGRVDVLLQSSARERRLIFEEAAGISLFKNKKLESLRRLDRVDQNLLRLSDIVVEVESRLQSIQSQAGKAQRYKEYRDSLQALRTEVALVDWHRLSEKLGVEEAQMAQLVQRHETDSAEMESFEKHLEAIDSEIDEINDTVRRFEGRILGNREKIAGLETTLEHQRRRSHEFEQEIVKYRRRLIQMNAQAGDLRQQIEQARREEIKARQRQEEVARELTGEESELARLLEELEGVRNQKRALLEREKKRTLEETGLGRKASSLETQVAESQSARQKHESRLDELQREREAIQKERDSLSQTQETLLAEVREADEQLQAARSAAEKTRRLLASAREESVCRRERFAAVSQRVAVLEDFQRRNEGLGSGVREVLSAAQNAPEGPFRQVVALVADLIRVSVESAPLVEAALGPAAGWIVLQPGQEILDHLEKQSNRFTGRVGFLRLDRIGRRVLPETITLSGRPGVLGRADQFVETDAAYRALVKHLLGNTWVVERMSHALRLVDEVPVGVRFVTLAGELLESDGTFQVGPSHAAGGLISRRSELRELKSKHLSMESQIDRAEADVDELEIRLELDKKELDATKKAHQEASERQGRHDHKITAVDERLAGLEKQQLQRKADLEEVQRRAQTATVALEMVGRDRQELQVEIAHQERELEKLAAIIEQQEGERQKHHRRATEIKVELAKSEERRHNLQEQIAQFCQSQEERFRNLDEHRQQLDRLQERYRHSERSLLQIESELATLYLDKERLAEETTGRIESRDQLRHKQTECRGEVKRANGSLRRLEGKMGESKMAQQELRSRRNELADRLREDYDIELAELETEPTEEQKTRREEAQKEIDQLRAKINGLGNVNLEALAELEDLDRRYQMMSGQLKDLTDAKNELLRIIDRINTDSRRLFAETLEQVRGHFRQLFRDLFGGGQADIVLEEDVDILESGIEIVARPPGKEPRNISLLSGGEKTMTCVALLLAIFRNRPSPFCVLDEVDAALDEANIDRFTKVLYDFQKITQFIMITHSKKTMTCADTIYGVTMQESGISKQVSVRFDDVSEDGHILPQAVNRAARAVQADDSDENRAA